jgi:hypothetical protein
LHDVKQAATSDAVIFALDDPLIEFKGGALAVNIAISSLIFTRSSIVQN